MSFKSTTFELKSRLGGGQRYGAMHRALREAEAWTPQELAAHQQRSRADLVRHAAAATDWYAELYRDHGDVIAALDSDPEAFSQLPVVEKQDIRANHDSFIAHGTDLRHTRVVRTGGSTGEPQALLHDTRVPQTVLGWRFWEWWGVQPGANVALLERPRRAGWRKVAHETMWWPSRRIHLDAGQMRDETLAAFLHEWNRAKPELFVGYAGALHEFARIIERTGARIEAPRAISSTAAPLPQTQRVEVQQILGAPVYDTYRVAEVPNIAAECSRQEGLHISADVRVLEVVDADGRPCPPGVEGDLVVTDLLNRVFPLVRYRLGDRGMLSTTPCPCGRPFPTIGPISGRITETLRLPSGKSIADGMMGLFVTPGMTRQYQIHQAADYSVDVRVVLGPHPDALAENERIVEVIRDRFERSVPVRLRLVDEIPHDRGKLKLIISDAPVPD